MGHWLIRICIKKYVQVFKLLLLGFFLHLNFHVTSFFVWVKFTLKNHSARGNISKSLYLRNAFKILILFIIFSVPKFSCNFDVNIHMKPLKIEPTKSSTGDLQVQVSISVASRPTQHLFTC